MPLLSRDSGRNGLSSTKPSTDPDSPRATPAASTQGPANGQSRSPPLAPQTSNRQRLDSGRKPAGPSPQQIMRARYKQQMMPPRTWRQQEERRKQIEAASQQRLAGSASTMRAAAAAASGRAPSSPQPTAAALSAGRQPGTQSKTSAYSIRPRSGSLEAAQSVTRVPPPPEPAGSAPSPEAGRPPMVRRGSSQNSLSMSAAAQAIQPRRRESVDSTHSSSSNTSRIVKPDDASRSEAPLSPSAARTNGFNGPRATSNAAIRSSPSSSSASTANTTSPRRARPASQFGGVPAPDIQKRSVTASAAARASIATPIQVNPREPLSSKFVSSLTQALKREMNERQELQNAKNAAQNGQSNDIEKMIESLAHLESVKSAASDGSAGSAGSAATSAKSSVPLQAARSSGSGSNRATQQPSKADIAEMEKKKANALSAALAAGGKAESEMARIHMQVNLAVQDALQTASRRELMKKYRPSSHWSAPVKPKRPQLQRLTTSDSTASTQNGTDTSGLRITGTNPATIKPWQVLPEAEDSGDSEPSTPLTPSSSVQSFGSVPMHSQYGDNIGASNSVPSLVQTKMSPASPSVSSSSPAPKSAEVSRWKTWTQNVLSKQRGGPKRNKPGPNGPGNNQALSQSPILGKGMSPGPSATYVSPGLVGQAPVLRQEPMVHTLRKTLRNKRFNEDEPWKNHQDLYYLSETERKRYEKLWAANRCTHLPFMFLNPEYEGLWHAAVARRFPQLYKKESNSDQASTKTTESANSHSAVSPSRSHRDRGDANDNGHHRAVSFNSIYSSDHPLKSPFGSTPGSIPDSPRSPYGAPETIKVESLEHILETANGPEPDREISPESVVGSMELEPPKEESYRDYLDDLQSVASSIEKDIDKQSEDVHGYVVSRLWRRSRLPEETLAEIWELVDTNKDGTLDRSSFVVGMWLCDQCLYGRKLPARVPYEVWQSVGKLHLKVRFKEPKSKTWYMSRLPNFMGSAVGHTMHGGRQAVKKVVQTATS